MIKQEINIASEICDLGTIKYYLPVNCSINNNYYFTVSPTNNIYWFSVWQKTKCVLKNSPAMEKNRGKCNLLLDFQLNISQP